MSTRKNTARRTPKPTLVRCCWLSPDQRMCPHVPTGRKIVFTDPYGISAGQWFWVPVCQLHGGEGKP